MSTPNSPCIPQLRSRTCSHSHSESLSRRSSMASLLHKLAVKVRTKLAKNSLSRDKDNDVLLSDFEIMLIKESWKPISLDTEAFGRKVYKRVFECDPDMKIFFAWPGIKDEELEYNPDFRRQAAAIIGVIDKCVKNVDNIEVVCDDLVSLGKRHTKLRAYGFKPDHWSLFKLSILLSVAVECDTSKHKQQLFEAWNTLISFIIEAMKYGFDEVSTKYCGSSASSSNTSCSCCINQL